MHKQYSVKKKVLREKKKKKKKNIRGRYLQNEERAVILARDKTTELNLRPTQYYQNISKRIKAQKNVSMDGRQVGRYIPRTFSVGCKRIKLTLDLNLSIANDLISTKILIFEMANVPCLKGEVLRRSSYCVNISNKRQKIAFRNKEHTTDQKMGVSILSRLFTSSNAVCNNAYAL